MRSLHVLCNMNVHRTNRVSPSVLTFQLERRWTDFHEIRWTDFYEIRYELWAFEGQILNFIGYHHRNQQVL